MLTAVSSLQGVLGHDTNRKATATDTQHPAYEGNGEIGFLRSDQLVNSKLWRAKKAAAFFRNRAPSEHA
jgi:hypothetical protein